MGLNVWYGLEDHPSLASANRLKKKLYQASKGFKGKLNAVDLEYVGSIEQIP